MGKRSRELRERRLRGEFGPKRGKPPIAMEKILKTVIFSGTVLILFTPLILGPSFYFPFVGPKSLYFMGLTEVIFFCWIFLMIFHPRYRPKVNLILLTLVSFLLVSIIASIFGVDPFYSFWSKFERMTGILMMLHLLAFFVVISSIFKERDWVKIFSVSIFVGIILSFIALVSKNPSMQGGATVGNDSFLGTYLLFDLFFAIYLVLKSKGGVRIYSLICFLIMASWLLLSEARAAKLAFLGGLVLLLFLWLAFNEKKALKITGRILLALSVLCVIFFVIFAFQSQSFVRKEMVERVTGETFGGRFVVWQGAWQGFLERPWLGWGLENFEYSFSTHFDPCMGSPRCGADIWYDRAHNIIFDTLINSGIVGFIFYLLLFGSLFWILWNRYLKKKIDFWTVGVFSSVLIAYGVQNLTVFDMISSYMIFFLTLSFISLIGSQRETVQTESAVLPTEPISSSVPDNSAGKSRLEKRLTALGLVVLLAVCLFEFTIKPLQTDRYTIEAFTAQSSKERLALYQKTLATSPVGRYQIVEQFADYLLSMRAGLGSSISVADYKAEGDFLSGELEDIIKRSPLVVGAYLKLGEIYNSYSGFEPEKLAQAEEVLNKAIDISPENQQLMWEMVQTKLYQGKREEAFSLAEKTMNLEPTRGEGHFVLIQVVMIMGNKELAQQLADEALKIDPSWESQIKSILGS
jgi:O-antigen ligase